MIEQRNKSGNDVNGKDVLLATVVGTTAMTLFSYVFSGITGKNYKEPKLLGEVIQDKVPPVKKDEASRLGWLLHYAVGGLFAGMYMSVMKKNDTPRISRGILLGSAAGVVGCVIWELTFRTSKKKPPRAYYPHLVIAHMVLGSGIELALGSKRIKQGA